MKTYTAKQAIAQILKMNATQGKLYNQMEYEAGRDWYQRKLRNEKRNEKMQELGDKIEAYKQFITEEDYNNSDLPCTLCMNWNEFID